LLVVLLFCCSLFFFNHKEIWKVKYSTKPVGKDDVFWDKQKKQEIHRLTSKMKRRNSKKNKTAKYKLVETSSLFTGVY
jgi:hypothetical protein